MNGEFLGVLYTNKLLSGNLKDEINELKTRQKKASKFLDDVIKSSFAVVGSKRFDELLKVMENYDDQNVNDLSKQLKEALEAAHVVRKVCGMYYL